MAGGMISQDDVQKVREATDLVALVSERTPVKQRGREFWACCPLHQEKTPSFKIDPGTQLWHCFGCGEGGDVFGLVMQLDELTFPEAVRKLAERAHIDIAEDAWDGHRSTKRQRLKEVCKAAAEFFHLQLMRGKDAGSEAARSYLSGRGLGGDIPRQWMLGFAPGRSSLVRHLTAKGFNATEMTDANVARVGRDGRLVDRFFNRVMFPIRDAQGDVIAFGGRIMEGEGPKYLNSQETPIFHKSNVLYGLDMAKAAMTSTGTAIVTEGYTDVIAMHKAGLANTVAALGTALTKNHVRLLSRHAGRRIVYIFDGDEAGQRATDRALQFIDASVTPESGRSRIDICALTLPDGMDPAEYLDAHSAEEMQELVAQAKPLIMFGIERRLARHDRGTAEGRAAALADALDVLAPIKSSILAKDYAAQVANMLRFREDDVLEQLSRLVLPRRRDDVDEGRYAGRGRQAGSAADATHASSANGGAPSVNAGLHGGGGVRQARSTPRLSVAERNRINTEREFLSMSAQNPVCALSFAETLKNVKWHDAVHLDMAESLLETLMDKLDATPAQIIERASEKLPHASRILTSSSLHGDAQPGDVLRFLSEELLIGDVEEELAILKSRQNRGVASAGTSAGASAGDAGDGGGPDPFQQIVNLQDRLNVMKNSHKPLE